MTRLDETESPVATNAMGDPATSAVQTYDPLLKTKKTTKLSRFAVFRRRQLQQEAKDGFQK